MLYASTGFTYRGLSPHKFTPMPGVHNALAHRWKLRYAPFPLVKVNVIPKGNYDYRIIFKASWL
jgi:hypothetical protein